MAALALLPKGSKKVQKGIFVHVVKGIDIHAHGLCHVFVFQPEGLEQAQNTNFLAYNEMSM